MISKIKDMLDSECSDRTDKRLRIIESICLFVVAFVWVMAFLIACALVG